MNFHLQSSPYIVLFQRGGGFKLKIALNFIWSPCMLYYNAAVMYLLWSEDASSSNMYLQLRGLAKQLEENALNVI